MKKKLWDIIKDLECLGYFKYAAPEDLDDVMTEFERCIREYGEIGTTYFREPDREFIGKAYRYILCDHENLIESMGTETLEFLDFYFARFHLPFDWKTNYEAFDKKRNLSYSEIEINGKTYLLYITNWSTYAYDFVKMINDQLGILGSPERLYLIAPGNDGGLIFLDKELKAYFDKNILLRPTFTPMETDRWIKKYRNA